MTKPKILIVNKYHFISGGAEKYFFKVMEALRKRDFEPIPFSVNYPQTVPTPYQKYFIDPVVKNGKAKIQNMKPTLAEQWELAQRAIYNETAKKAVRRICEEERPVLAYFLNFNNHISPSAIDACHDAGIPVVMRMSDYNLTCASNMYHRNGHPCTDCRGGLHHALLNKCVHGSMLRSAVQVFANSLHRLTRVYDKVDAFVCPTEFMRQELLDLGFPESKVHQVNTFVKPCSQPPSVDLENPYILFVGRFVPYKGTEASIRAFAKLKDIKNIRLKMVGDEGDAEAARLKKIAAELGETRIEFLPFERNPEKVHEMSHRALFSLVPSEFYENLPNTLIESYACGRPVIATRLGSMVDLVPDEKYGLLFEYGDYDDYAAKMRRLIEDAGTREEMGRRVRMAAVEDYSEQGHMQQLFSIFQQCAAPSARKFFNDVPELEYETAVKSSAL